MVNRVWFELARRSSYRESTVFIIILISLITKSVDKHCELSNFYTNLTFRMLANIIFKSDLK